jgi:hypothetical protein
LRALEQALGLQNKYLRRAENHPLITRALLVLLFAAPFGVWFGAWFLECTVTQANNGLRWKVHSCTSFSLFFSELTRKTLPQARHRFPLYLYDPNSTVSLNTGGPQNLNPTANVQQSQHELISQKFPFHDPNSLCRRQNPEKLMEYRHIGYTRVRWASVRAKRVEVLLSLLIFASTLKGTHEFAGSVEDQTPRDVCGSIASYIPQSDLGILIFSKLI